jgi:hypothetical protein
MVQLSDAEILADPERALACIASDYDKDPLGFVNYFFEERPRKFQAEVLDAIGDHLRDPQTRFEPFRCAIASGHGIGKSSLIGMVMAWALSTQPDTRIVATAGTGAQLNSKLVPEVQRWFRKLLNADWFELRSFSIRAKANPQNWRSDYVVWSADNPQAFAGLHNAPDADGFGGRLLVIFDEASTIADSIWETAEGSLTDSNTEIIWLAFGQPTHLSGRFFRCFNADKHRWVTRQIDSRTVPGTNLKLIEQWAEDHGEDSDFFRVRVRGEFPRSAASQFISSEVVEAARHFTAVDYEGFPKIGACDVARYGDDQTVLGHRQGRLLVLGGKHRGKGADWVASECIRYYDAHQLDALVIDEDGVGGPVLDIIRSRGSWRVEGFHGGATAHDATQWFNRRTECWGKLRSWLEAGAQIPDDPELAQDLTGPEYYFAGGKKFNGSIQLEGKDEMKARGLSWPDAGDMAAMTFAVEIRPRPKPQPDRWRSRAFALAGEQSWMA